MRALKLRLRAMMFFQFIAGATIQPILALYLRDYLHFTGAQTGLVIGMSAVSALVSPVLGSLVADRLLRVERLYGLCHIAAGTLMLILSFEHRFLPVLFGYLLYMLVYGPTGPLTNVITLHHSPDARRRFGGIRLWGTVGWVAVAWFFGYFWLRGGGGAHLSDRLPDALVLASAVSFFLAFYSLLLPRSPAPLNRSHGSTAATDRPQLFPREALRILAKPEVALFLALSLVIYATHTYYYLGAAIFLVHIGVPSDSIMPLMSIGQIVEVGVIGVLGLLLSRFSFRAIFIAGMVAELFRFGLLAVGSPLGVVVASIALHGVCFGLIFAVAPIFLDSHSSVSTRAGVQQFFTVTTTGLGALLGNLTAGELFDAVTAGGVTRAAFREYWLVPTVVSVVVGVVIVIFFRKLKAPEGTPPTRRSYSS